MKSLLFGISLMWVGGMVGCTSGSDSDSSSASTASKEQREPTDEEDVTRQTASDQLRDQSIPANTQAIRDQDRESDPDPGAPSIEKAEQLAAMGKLIDADVMAKQILILDPKNARAIFLIANLQAGYGRLDEAVELLGSIDRDSGEAYLPSLGQAADWLIQLKRFEEAEKNYQTILELVPSADVARRPLAELLNRRGMRQQAAAIIMELAGNGNVTEEELHALLSVPDAFFDSDEETDFTPIGNTGKARIEFTKGSLQSAQQLMEAADPKELERSGALAFYGRLLAENQQFDLMPDWLSRCNAETEAWGDFWFAIGAWMLWEDRVDEAIASYAKSIVRVPTDRIALNRLAECLRRAGQESASNWCKARSESIAETMRLATRIARSAQADPETVDKLAQLIEELDRPLEAVMWRGVAASYRGEGPDKMRALNQQRLALIQNPANKNLHLPESLRGTVDQEADFLASLPRATRKSFDRTGESVRRGQAKFINVAAQVGLQGSYFNSTTQNENMRMLHEQIGGGVAVLDYDLDGKPDLYFTQGASKPELTNLNHWNGTMPNALWRQQDGAFSDVTGLAEADDRGYGQGVTAGDFNADGFPDLLVANIGQNRLLINNGDGTFRDQSEVLQDGDGRWTTSVALADLDGDHLPDVFESNYVGDPKVFDESLLKVDPASGMLFSVRPGDYPGMSDRVFLSDGLGRTQSVELQSSEEQELGDGLAILVTDIDGQGGNEVFVANDMRANQYWVPKPNESFELVDQALLAGCAYSGRGDANACMGIAAADYDQDGDLDLAITNFYLEPMNFFTQKSPGLFQDLAAKSNLFTIGFNVNGFGTQPLDYDHNGRVDLVVMNGHIHDNRAIGQPFRMLPQLIDGSDAQFQVVEVEDSSEYWTTPTLGRAVATLDWNHDGRLDLVTTHIDHPHALLENQSETLGAYLQLELVGTSSERDAIGARIDVQVGDRRWYSTVSTGDGFSCKNEKMVCFGLGETSAVDRLKIRWPSGIEQEFSDLAVNHRYLVVESEETLIMVR